MNTKQPKSAHAKEMRAARRRLTRNQNRDRRIARGIAELEMEVAQSMAVLDGHGDWRESDSPSALMQ